jgi:hypothetical protein
MALERFPDKQASWVLLVPRKCPLGPIMPTNGLAPDPEASTHREQYSKGCDLLLRKRQFAHVPVTSSCNARAARARTPQ